MLGPIRLAPRATAEGSSYYVGDREVFVPYAIIWKDGKQIRKNIEIYYASVVLDWGKGTDYPENAVDADQDTKDALKSYFEEIQKTGKSHLPLKLII